MAIAVRAAAPSLVALQTKTGSPTPQLPAVLHLSSIPCPTSTVAHLNPSTHPDMGKVDEQSAPSALFG